MKLKSFLDYDGPGYRAPMTPDESKTFIKFLMMDMDIPSLEQANDKMKQVFATDLSIRIFTSRLHGVQATPAAILHAASSSGGSPGNLVMWAYTFVHIAEKKGFYHVDMTDLCKYFPFGFPTKKAMSECWDAQKQDSREFGGDNAMDVDSNWVIEK